MAWSYEKHFLPYKSSVRWRRLEPAETSNGYWIPWAGYYGEEKEPRFLFGIETDRSHRDVISRLYATSPDKSSPKLIETKIVGPIGIFDDGTLERFLQERYGLETHNLTAYEDTSFDLFTDQSMEQVELVHPAQKIRRTILLEPAFTSRLLPEGLQQIHIVDRHLETGRLLPAGNSYGSPVLPEVARNQMKAGVDSSLEAGFVDAHTAGYTFKRSTPRPEVRDMELGIPKSVAEAYRAALEEQRKRGPKPGLFSRPDTPRLLSSKPALTRLAQAAGYGGWYQGALPDPDVLEQFVGGPSVDYSPIASFGRAQEAIQMVNQFDPSLLRNVAFIFNTAGGAFGVYVPALDESIRLSKVKKFMQQQGYVVEDKPNGLWSVYDPKEQAMPEQLQQRIQQLKENIRLQGGNTIGINLQRVLQTSRTQATQMGLNLADERDWSDLAVLHLGETIAHESAHAKGATSEGPAESTGSAFVAWALPRLNQQRQQKSQPGKEYQLLQVDPSRRVHAAKSNWYRLAAGWNWRNRAPQGAQFSLQQQLPESTYMPPWSGTLWSSGLAVAESMLSQCQQGPVRQSFEWRMQEKRKKDGVAPLDPLLTTEELLGKDHQAFTGYDLTEKMMEDRRPKPLAVAASMSSSHGGLAVTAQREGSMFGWMNNLDLPMSERIIEGNLSDEFLFLNWDRIPKQTRYNPEYDFGGIFYRWIEPRYMPELWDRTPDEHPFVAPAKRFARRDKSHGRLAELVLKVLRKARELLTGRKIEGTRFVMESSLLPVVERFFASTPELRVHPVGGDAFSPPQAVWVVRSDLAEEKLSLAEAYCARQDGSEEAQMAFDAVTRLSEEKKSLSNAILDAARSLCRRHGIRGVYLVGGYPRLLALREAWMNLRDLDFSGAWPDECVKLGGLLAERLGLKNYEFYHRTMTLSWNWRGVKCDFRGYFTPVSVRELLRAHNIAVTPLHLDIYARDFTINMLICDLMDGKLYDITRRSKKDLRDGLIRTVFDPDRIVPQNPLLILRALKYRARYGFAIDPALAWSMRRHREKLFGGQYGAERLQYALEDIRREGKTKAETLIEEFGLEKLYVLEKENKHAISH